MSLRGKMIEKGVHQARKEENDQILLRREVDRSLLTTHSVIRAQSNHRELSFKNKLKELGLKHNKCFRIGKLAQCEGAREEDEETEERMAFCEKCVASGKVVQEPEGTVVDRLYRAHLADVQVMSFGEDSKEKISKFQDLMTKRNRIKVRSLKQNTKLTEAEETLLAQYDLINATLNRPSVPLLEDDNGQQRQYVRPRLPQEWVENSMQVCQASPRQESYLDGEAEEASDAESTGSDSAATVSTTHSIAQRFNSL